MFPAEVMKTLCGWSLFPHSGTAERPVSPGRASSGEKQEMRSERQQSRGQTGEGLRGCSLGLLLTGSEIGNY